MIANRIQHSHAALKYVALPTLIAHNAPFILRSRNAKLMIRSYDPLGTGKSRGRVHTTLFLLLTNSIHANLKTTLLSLILEE